MRRRSRATRSTSSWSFIAGWAILLDYLIVMAIVRVLRSRDYLSAFWGVGRRLGHRARRSRPRSIGVGGLVEHPRDRRPTGCGAVMRVGAREPRAVARDRRGRAGDGASTRARSSTRSTSARRPSGRTCCSRAVIASVATTGVEAASGLAGEVRVGRRGLKRLVMRRPRPPCSCSSSASSLVGVMALPVEDGAYRARRASALEAPVLGIVSSSSPEWVSDALRLRGRAASARSCCCRRPTGRCSGSRGSPTRSPRTGRSRAPLGRLHPQRLDAVRRGRDRRA